MSLPASKITLLAFFVIMVGIVFSAGNIDCEMRVKPVPICLS